MILGRISLSSRGRPDFQMCRLPPELKGGTGRFWGFEPRRDAGCVTSAFRTPAPNHRLLSSVLHLG